MVGRFRLMAELAALHQRCGYSTPQALPHLRQEVQEPPETLCTQPLCDGEGGMAVPSAAPAIRAWRMFGGLLVMALRVIR